MKKDIFITITVCGLALLLIYIGGLDSNDKKNILGQLSSATAINESRGNNVQSDNIINSRNVESLISDYSSTSKDTEKGDFLLIENLKEKFIKKKNLLQEKSSNSYQDIKNSLFKKTGSIENNFKSKISNLPTAFNRKIEDVILKDVCKSIATD